MSAHSLVFSPQRASTTLLAALLAWSLANSSVDRTYAVQGEGNIARVQSRVFDVDYAVHSATQPLDAVILWYTLDRGQTWHQYGADADRQPPFAFNAPGEGLYGLFLIASNGAGASSMAPTAGTMPHTWVYVDFTPPIAQMQKPMQAVAMDRPVVQIRWTAIDAHLRARPIELSYRPVGDQTWLPVTTDPLANTGRYDWPIPQDLHGPIAIRLAASDEGGHRVMSEPQVIELHPAVATANNLTGQPLTKASTVVAEPKPRPKHRLSINPDAITGEISAAARERAVQFYREGLIQRDAGELRQGVSRMRQAVAINPELTQAFVEMGRLHYLLGNLGQAADAYGIALQQQPRSREALRGAAMVDLKKNEYGLAAEKLRTILRYNARDAQVWLDLGDVAVFKGDNEMAADCFRRAATVDPGKTAIIEKAQLWLDLIGRYKPDGAAKGQ